ncbi:hypothetical protein BEWA_005250 [Theileria equi strain WA]|uniref:Uncharacterized protein n=1 Tax=Theileria equi strain WA TaxID=1537102 RepID=L0AZT6_THEEQ|nr:hypothetical protein BEWA_005250 [Theileria equi strain WA]AFZ81117.1 hypothetical protein BEWA_005250 [Theileria equi strain WA]|eukprot:XP_004830783.1 hypothetical protein BEWA_005250 [Theileria equi strain WA]
MVILSPLISEELKISCSHVVSIIDDYSRDSLLKLQEKRTFPTSSRALNSSLGGGLRTQEIVELVGFDHLSIGELLTHITIDHLYNNQNFEALIISTNGSPNEYELYQICRGFLEKKETDKHIDDSIFNVLRRIYIINCLSDIHLSKVLDDLLEGRFSGGKSLDLFKSKDRQDLTLLQIQGLSSLFDNMDAKSTKCSSALLAIKLRNLCTNSNCSILISNFQTALLSSNSASYDPYIESDNPAFSKLSQKWHSSIDTKIYVLPLKKKEQHTRIMIKVIKSKRERSGRICHISFSKQGIQD